MNDLITTALSQYWVKEEHGSENNSPQILAYFNLLGHAWAKTDETAWCAAFVNWCLKTNGYKDSCLLTARSLLTGVGQQVFEPKLGDIGVLWRISHDGPWGHTGFWLGNTPEDILLWGGNQDNKVCAKRYPLYRLLAWIRPEKLV